MEETHNHVHTEGVCSHHEHHSGHRQMDTLLLQTAVLLLYVALVLRLFLRDEIVLYIKSDLSWLMAIAGIFIVTMLLFTISAIGRSSSAEEGDGVAFYGLRAPVKEVAACIVMMLPALLGLVLAPQPLDAFAVSKRGISGQAPMLRQALEPIRSKEVSLLQLSYGLQQNPKEFLQKDFAFVGFVHHEESLGSSSFYLVRFVVSCCAADATPLGFAVISSDAGNLKDNQWVKVEGRVVQETAGQEVSYRIEASRIEPVRKPAYPYL